MSLFKRGMIFATFFGSCLALALLVTSLGTKHWVSARARRTINPVESDGKVHYGLFEGKKELNVAYGWRSYDIDVVQLLKQEPEFLAQGYWLGTVACILAGLLFSAISGVFAAVNAATTPCGCFSGVKGLYLWNFLSLVADLGAIAFWVTQYFLRIQYNVLPREDRDNRWTSEGMAMLGYSFWFVVGAAITSFINILIIHIANSETREVASVYPVLEEKTNGAIMLY